MFNMKYGPNAGLLSRPMAAALQQAPQVPQMQEGKTPARRPRGLFGRAQDWLSQTGDDGISRADRIGTIGALLRDNPAVGQNALAMQQERVAQQQALAREQQERQGAQNTAQKAQLRRRETALQRGYSPELADMYAQDPESFFGLVSNNLEASNVNPGQTRMRTFGGNVTVADPLGERDADRQDALARSTISDRSQDNALARERFGLEQQRAESERAAGPWDEVNALRDDAEGAIGDFREIEASYQRILDSAVEPSAAGDLALIFNYMKMLDPGSTVREGEFANAQNAGGVSARARAAYNSAMRGERLSQDQRSDFLSRAQRLYGGQRTLAEERLSQFEEQANQRFSEQYREQALPQLSDFSLRERALEDQSQGADDRLNGDAPQPGDVIDGYQFLGGDASDERNWRSVQ